MLEPSEETPATHASHAASRATDEAARYAAVVESLPTVLYEYAWDARRTTWISENVQRVTGWPASRWLGSDAWDELVHPDDRDAALDALRASMEVGRFRAEYRLRHADGSWHWYRDTGTIVIAGEAPMVRGVLADITEQRALAERERAYADLLLGLTGSLELGHVLQRIVDVAVRLLDADVAIISTPSDDGEALELRAQSGPSRAGIHRASLDDTSSLSVRAYLSGCAETIADYAALPSAFATQVRGPSLGHVAALPVELDGEIAAVVTVGRTRGKPAFDARVLADLRLLGTHAAQAIANARRYAEARAASDAKSQFLSTMSHELRTPLNAIEGFLSLLEMRIVGPLTDAQGDYVARARRAGRHLLRIIEDILDLSRVERGGLLVERRVFPAGEPLVQAVEVIRPQLRHSSAGLRASSPPADLAAAGDPHRVRQILINLLGNAAKFTRRGEIVATTSADDANVRYTVRDTGPGIAPEHLERIFEPFYQVDGALTRASQGTGLGLAVSRHLARAMGGDLVVHSTVGEGSEFTLVLPRG